MSDASQDPGLGPGMQRPSADSHALPAAPADRSSEFVAVSGAEEETTSATTMLVSAYIIFWLLLLGFVWMTWRRQQRLAERLRIIEARLASSNTGDHK
jgi:hypothetical protein